jgi:hypothetical protein
MINNGGIMSRLLIAVLLLSFAMCGPQVVVLDDPTASSDNIDESVTGLQLIIKVEDSEQRYLEGVEVRTVPGTTGPVKTDANGATPIIDLSTLPPGQQVVVSLSYGLTEIVTKITLPEKGLITKRFILQDIKMTSGEEAEKKGRTEGTIPTAPSE